MPVLKVRLGESPIAVLLKSPQFGGRSCAFGERLESLVGARPSGRRRPCGAWRTSSCRLCIRILLALIDRLQRGQPGRPRRASTEAVSRRARIRLDDRCADPLGRPEPVPFGRSPDERCRGGPSEAGSVWPSRPDPLGRSLCDPLRRSAQDPIARSLTRRRADRCGSVSERRHQGACSLSAPRGLPPPEVGSCVGHRLDDLPRLGDAPGFDSPDVDHHDLRPLRKPAHRVHHDPIAVGH